MAKKSDYDFGDALTLAPREGMVIDQDAQDTWQLCERLDLKPTAVRARIKAALDAGTIERVWKHKLDSAGRKSLVPAYRPIQKGGKAC